MARVRKSKGKTVREVFNNTRKRYAKGNEIDENFIPPKPEVISVVNVIDAVVAIFIYFFKLLLR